MKRYLETALAKTELNTEDTEFYTKTGVKDFESYAKRNFRSKSAECTVIVADSRFNNPDIKTRRGRMTIPGSTVQTFFDPCVNEIKSSVDAQIGTRKVPYLILLGGLGANGYVQSEFKRHYESRRSKLILSDDSSCKAVADGAVIWGTSDNVVARAPRYSFGVEARLPYRRSLINDLAGRKPYTSLAGDLRVSGGWSEIVHKGDPINAGVIHRQTYRSLYKNPTLRSNAFEVKLWAYSGNDKPKWARSRHGERLDRFRVVCTITAKLEAAEGGMKMRINPSGSEYWELEFCVCIRFSGTELESFLEWKENGVQKTGAASIVLPEEDILD
ncbi:unnamed protein product [Rhizoctonia solani]|uniref:Uncharacterized protein n=1 Tax=Rhizoctonia solani TaxID=456999 RepID=A0A8H3E1V6_9AGAM|nr:unnamed protein product [Rhizoctonia solani]